MPALFERAVGDDWTGLHPQVRRRYGLVADEGRIAVGRGEMRDLRNNALALPVLWLGTVDDFLFPESGSDVPFTITTEAFVDENGHEGLVLTRRFETDPPRTFVDVLRWNPERECLTDIFGRRGLVAADLHLGVDGGDLTLELGTQWLRMGGRYVQIPGALAAAGSLRDYYDDATGRFRVTASITAPVLGEVFGYAGWFDNEIRPSDGDVTDGGKSAEAVPTASLSPSARNRTLPGARK